MSLSRGGVGPPAICTNGGIQTVLDELSKEPKVKTSKFDDVVDLRVLIELEREGVFK